MSEKYLIVVEGKADAIFLKDYLMHLDKSLSITTNFDKKNKIAIILKSEYAEIKILVAGGYTVIKEEKFLKSLNEYIDSNYKILIIQDADNPSKDNGGVQNRIKYLELDSSIEFKAFFFPNNKDDGDLETLLLRIKKNDQYNTSNGCYQYYIDCTKKINPEWSAELEEDKSLVFNYFRTYYGMENSKEENRKYEADYWDFESDKLNPLKDFFEKNLFMDASDIG
jgi:hypothetical protein